MSTLRPTRYVSFIAPGEVEVRTGWMPLPGPHEIQVETHFSGISAGTESWALHNKFTWEPTVYPCVPGYQRVGVVTALGAEVSGFAIGQRVFATVAKSVPGIPMKWGGHISLANTQDTEVFALPPGVDDINAANAIVAQVGYNAASRLTLEPGAWVVIYGDGLIGQSAAQAACARGYRAILVGHREPRLALARHFSTYHAINRKAVGVSMNESVPAMTRGEKVLGVLDSVQTVAAQKEYVGFLERGVGQIVYCGFTPGDCWADMALLQQRELTTHYVSGWTPARLHATFRLFAEGRMSLKPLMTHILPYQEAPEAYRLIDSKTTDSLGLTLDWRRKMKILITGACGWLSRALVAELEKGGHELRLLDRINPEDATVFVPGQLERKVMPLKTSWPYLKVELLDLPALRAAAQGMDAIMHLAAATTGLPEHGPAIMQANVTGTYNVLDAARLEGVKRVGMASSINAFGTMYWRISGRPANYRSMPLTEEFRPEPEDPYSLSKWFGEEICHAFTRAYGITTAAFRFAGVQPQENVEKMRREVQPTKEWNDDLFQWVHVDDIAAGLRRAFECPALPAHGVYSLGAADTRCPEPTMELLQRLRPDLAANVISPLPDRTALLSIANAQKAFGYAPKHRLF